MPDSAKLDDILATLDASLPQAQARLLEFLCFPSIPTDAAQCRLSPEEQQAVQQAMKGT